MLTIRQAVQTDAQAIHQLAPLIWQKTYTFLAEEQIEFMLQDRYNQATLEDQINTGILYFLAEFDTDFLGFGSVQEKENQVWNLDKLYILPSAQGKGVADILLEKIIAVILEKKATVLTLNVHRENKRAVAFYQKKGFKIVREIDIPMNKFWLNDYILEKQLT